MYTCIDIDIDIVNYINYGILYLIKCIFYV